MRTVLFIAAVVLLGTAGDMAVSHAMKRTGTFEFLSPSSIGRALLRAFRNVWMWAGIAFMTAAFFSLLAVLSWADVSVVVPATSLSYVTGALGARFLLGENVEPIRWAGILLVCAGVALVSAS